MLAINILIYSFFRLLSAVAIRCSVKKSPFGRIESFCFLHSFVGHRLDGNIMQLHKHACATCRSYRIQINRLAVMCCGYEMANVIWLCSCVTNIMFNPLKHFVVLELMPTIAKKIKRIFKSKRCDECDNVKEVNDSWHLWCNATDLYCSRSPSTHKIHPISILNTKVSVRTMNS